MFAARADGHMFLMKIKAPTARVNALYNVEKFLTTVLLSIDRPVGAVEAEAPTCSELIGRHGIDNLLGRLDEDRESSGYSY